MYQDAINIINGGGAIAGHHFDGTGSMDVEDCFIAGTPIHLADGTGKPIEEIQPGDEVLARPHDNPTGELASYRVIQGVPERPAASEEQFAR